MGCTRTVLGAGTGDGGRDSSDSNAGGPRFRSFCLWQFLIFPNTAQLHTAQRRPLPNPAARALRLRRRWRFLCWRQHWRVGVGISMTARVSPPASLRRHFRCIGHSRQRRWFRRSPRPNPMRSCRRFLRCLRTIQAVWIRFFPRCGSWSRAGASKAKRAAWSRFCIMATRPPRLI